MNKLSERQKQIYYKEEYLLIKNVIDHNYVDELMDFVTHVISLESKVERTSENKEYILNNVMIHLKQKNPSSSSWIYQTILGSFKLKKFFTKIGIEKLAADLLGIEDENNLGIVSPAFRFDIPGDTKNIRNWHQDGNYFLENEKGEDHLVVWIPMNSAKKENGSVIIAPGSHTKGKIKADYLKGEDYKSEQWTVSKDYYSNINPIYIEAEKGDVAFINMDLLHSSGVNVTKNEVRYTAQIRFNKINSSDFRPVFLKPEYPVYKRNK